ncbi:hypothetical protein HMPREF1486_05438 [Streptomyces sp. HPH0547]|nr:hypothetical protein HMPREF1486_05438 [Streptomyces sp. HPH0547]
MSKSQEAVGEHRGTEALLAALDAADQTPNATRLRARSYELLSPVPGSTVVDVGCGAGRAVAELAERGIHAVGVDPSPWMLAAARSRGARWRRHDGFSARAAESSWSVRTGTAS